jgi:hypothetical protein
MATTVGLSAHLRNIGLLLSFGLTLTACAGPSEGEIRQKLLLRVGADSNLHKASVLRMTNIFAPEDEGNGAKGQRGTFQRLELDGGQCILVRDADFIPFSHDLQKKVVSYRNSLKGAQTWPITLFALDQDCLPAELES